MLRLNLRAALQFLRCNGHAVAGTAVADLVEGGDGTGGHDGRVADDAAIFEPGIVRFWEMVDTVGLGAHSGRKASGDDEQDMAEEIEPGARRD